MATSNCDRRGSWTLLKKLKLTTFAMSTRLEVAAIESLIGSFMGCLILVNFSTYVGRPAPGSEVPFVVVAGVIL
jgi:hypothetical protein